MAKYYLAIGVVDYEKCRNNSQIIGWDNDVSYWCTSANTGYKYPGNVSYGTGYAVGQIV